MKTMTVGSNDTRLFWGLALVAGLAGLYFYQQRGGRISDLAREGYRGLSKAREKISDIAPSVAGDQATQSVSTTAQV